MVTRSEILIAGVQHPEEALTNVKVESRASESHEPCHRQQPWSLWTGPRVYLGKPSWCSRLDT